ncbi:uncharacterized protein [Atheta coriaria]|uniref:uncharacterized protein n=1 Tax=Dalotia coriaria TaxID=877792 RepID=UPI0031F35352
MVEQIADLNYDFNYNLFLAKRMMDNLQTNAERQRVIRWMRKLIACRRSVEEMKLRNDFMYYLVLNVQNRDLRPPFHESPPPGPLPELSHLLPGSSAESLGEAGAWQEKENKKKPILYEYSPDGGAFLASQPIPRCGAFCYLAVVSRTSNK